MAVLAAGKLTLLDAAKRWGPDGGVLDLAELLSQENELLEDIVYVEANQPTSHRVGIRTGLPAVYFRQINAGVPTSKSTTATVDEPVSMLEAYSEIDVDLIKLNAHDPEFRQSEDAAFIESMNQQQASTLMYGNHAADPKAYTGLATRYSSLSAGNAVNILDAGGTQTDNTSIYLVAWGQRTVFCTYPKGSKAGLIAEDLGVDVAVDPNNAAARLKVARSHFKWDNGLVVRDWRYAVRIANIDVSNLVSESSAADLPKLLVKAIARIPTMNNVRPVFYANRTLYEMFMIQSLNKSQNVVKVEEALSQFGSTIRTLKFMGIPMRLVDQILNTEARVT